MQALLLVAHGSRRDASNAEVFKLAEVIANAPALPFSCVRAAFLELAEPSIPAGIHQCVAAGATEVRVLPYFLNTGRHVAEDIPHEVNQARAELPDVDVRLLPHIGAGDAMIELLIKKATESAQ